MSQPSSGRLRVAVVGGAGTWGHHYLRTFAGHPECEVVGLVDRARERRDAFAARYGVAATYDSVTELLAETVPDIVSAIVPVGQNHPVVKELAEGGVRVVSCEKPISAVLAEADDMVALCRARGTLLACGQAAWAAPRMPQVAQWIRDGNLGRLTAAAIPGGLPVEVSGGGCVPLAGLRLLTGLEVEWAQGWELPPVGRYVAPDTNPIEADVPMYGRLGLQGGAICEILEPQAEGRRPCHLSLTGENGQVWLMNRRPPVLIRGTGARATPVFPEFLDETDGDYFLATIQRLIDAFDNGTEPLSSGDDYHHALETAIALKLSAANDHARIQLPLPDRGHRLLPHPYRLDGGDVAGWESIGYDGPPEVPTDMAALATFEELAAVPNRDIQRLLRQVDQAELVVALLDADPVVEKRLLSNMSARVQGSMADEMQAAKATAEETARARAHILELARGL